ncbi:MAG: glycogen/starch synthase [Candidatus Margulisiibacteriota bacterium]
MVNRVVDAVFAHRKGNVRRPVVLLAGHEPTPTEGRRYRNDIPPHRWGFGQAIGALHLGLTKEGVSAVSVNPYSGASYEYDNSRSDAGDMELSIKVPGKDVEVKLVAIAARDELGLPTISIRKVSEPHYFAFDVYGNRTSEISTKLTAPEGECEGGIYKGGKMTEAMLVFNLALAQIAQKLNAAANAGERIIFHGNDHLTGLATFLVNGAGIPTAFTIHNPAYTTIADASVLASLQLSLPDRATRGGTADLLALAMIASKKLTTVSPTYAREIGSTGFSYGPVRSYGDILGRRDVIGILNGLLPSKVAKSIEGPSGPVRVLMANRLDPQKGYDYLLNGLPAIQGVLSALGEQQLLDIRVIADGDKKTQERLEALGKDRKMPLSYYPFSQERFEDGLKWAQIGLMPSMFEPCGLFAMTLQAQGPLLLANEVGGLRDILGSAQYWAAQEKEWETVLGTRNLTAHNYGMAFGSVLNGDPARAIEENNIFWNGLVALARKLKTEPQLFMGMRMAAMERAQNEYTPQRVAQQYMAQIYEKLMG